jgi:hypothetical protein
VGSLKDSHTHCCRLYHRFSVVLDKLALVDGVSATAELCGCTAYATFGEREALYPSFVPLRVVFLVTKGGKLRCPRMHVS